MRCLLLAACFIASVHGVAAAAAVTPLEIVHPFPPTGPVEVAGAVQANKVLRAIQRYATPTFTDLLALHVAHTLQGINDPQAVVSRRHRQAGHAALSYVSNAAPDGRTLLFAPSSGTARAMLRPIATVATMPYVMVTTADVPWATLGELVRDAMPRENRLLVGSPGGQSAGHAALRAARSRLRVPFEAVSYNGGNAALQAVAQKQVVASLVPLPTVLPYLPAGRLRAIAIADTRRHRAIPMVRTSAESGFQSLEAVGGFAVFAPAATRAAVARTLDAQLRRIDTPDAAALFESLGVRLEHRPLDAG